VKERKGGREKEKKKNGGPEKVSDFPKVTQQISGKVGI
jgi:hypothetical protein